MDLIKLPLRLVLDKAHSYINIISFPILSGIVILHTLSYSISQTLLAAIDFQLHIFTSVYSSTINHPLFIYTFFLFSTKLSTTLGSASVVVSPNWSCSLAAIFLSILLII